MEDYEFISVDKIMVHHNLDKEFIDELELYQLVEFVVEGPNRYLSSEYLPELERIIRLYFDLRINMEGIDVIKHMIERMDTMHRTILKLENRLRLYE